jgi:hypothetical protein
MTQLPSFHRHMRVDAPATRHSAVFCPFHQLPTKSVIIHNVLGRWNIDGMATRLCLFPEFQYIAVK